MKDIFESLDILERIQKLLLGYVEKGLTLGEASELINAQSLALNGYELLLQKQNEESERIGEHAKRAIELFFREQYKDWLSVQEVYEMISREPFFRGRNLKKFSSYINQKIHERSSLL